MLRQIWHSYCRYKEYVSPEVWNLEFNITGFKSHIYSWRLPVMMSYGCYHANWREVGRGGNDLINGIKLSARSGARVLLGPFLRAAWIQCCWLVKRSVWWGPRSWKLIRHLPVKSLATNASRIKWDIMQIRHKYEIQFLQYACVCLLGIWTLLSTH